MPIKSSDKIVENFLHAAIHPIIGKPNYESIAEVCLKFNSNAKSDVHVVALGAFHYSTFS